jgi:hypothetical protein
MWGVGAPSEAWCILQGASPCRERVIQIGFHAEGYRIDKTASPMDFYTKWQITPEGKWINPKPTCFDSMPQEGWYKEGGK